MSETPVSAADPKTAIGYIRVSAVGDRDRSSPSYMAPDIQRESIERACTARNIELLDVVVEENRSGADRSRPKFSSLMDRILGHEADALVVWKVSRFSRSLTTAVADIETLEKAGKHLIAGDEPFDTSSPQGKLMLNLLLMFAEYERDVLSAGFEIVKQRAIDRGVTLGPAPLGYRHTGSGVLEPDPETQHLIPELFRRRAAGATYGELARFLDVQPETARLNSLWENHNVKAILQRRAYLGETRWRDQVTKDAHPALVDPLLFDKVQLMKDEVVAKRASPARHFPLTGVLRCCSCGGSMSGSVVKDRGEVKRANYLCSRRGTRGCAKPQGISAAVAEEHVFGELTELMSGLALVADTGSDAEMDQLRADLFDAELALVDLGSLEMRRSLGADWMPMMKRMADEKQAIQDQLDVRLRQAGVSSEALDWDNLDAEAREAALRSMVDRIVISPRAKGESIVSRIAIHWRGDDPDSMPGAQMAA